MPCTNINKYLDKNSNDTNNYNIIQDNNIENNIDIYKLNIG